MFDMTTCCLEDKYVVKDGSVLSITHLLIDLSKYCVLVAVSVLMRTTCF